MRKYLAWLSSTATLLVLGWMMIPKAFSGIADWFSPVFGPAFRPELYLAFIMFGPSLTYTPLLIVWVVAGVVGGFFSRGVWRSVAAGTLSTLTIITLMVLNGLLIITSLGGLNNISGVFSGLSIPPPPPGLGLADIVNAPLVGQIISAVTSGGGLNPISIAEIFLLNFLVNRIIHTVSFVASAVLFSKLFHREPQTQLQPVPIPVPTTVYAPTPSPTTVQLPGQPLLPAAKTEDPVPNPTSVPVIPQTKESESKPDSATAAPTLEIKRKEEKTEKQKPDESEDSSSGQPASKIAIILFILALSFTTIILPAGRAQILHASGPSGTSSGEQLQLNLQKDGTLKMSYSTNLTALPPGIPSDYRLEEYRSIAGAFIFSFNGSIDLGQNNGGGGGGGGGLATLASLLPPSGFLAVYQNIDQSTGKARADKLASDFQQGFGVTLTSTVSMMLPSFGGSGGTMYLAIYQADGTVGSTGNKILSLVQTTGVGTVLSSPRIFAANFGAEAGFLNFDSQSNSTGTPNLVPGAQISADLTQWGNFYGRGTFTLGVRNVLGTQGVIGPSSVAGSTSVQLGFPANSTVVTFWPLNSTVDAAAGKLSYSMNATSTPVSDVYVTFSNVFPQKIQVARTLDPASPVPSGTVVTEHVSVTNLGNESIQGVVASEKRLFQTYKTLKLVSLSENMSLGDIGPQATAQGTLVFKVTSDGIYTMPGVEIDYSDQNQTISKTTESAYLQSTFSVIVYAQQLVQGTAPWSYLLVFLSILPVIVQVVRSLRSRKLKVASRPVQVKGVKGRNW